MDNPFDFHTASSSSQFYDELFNNVSSNKDSLKHRQLLSPPHGVPIYAVDDRDEDYTHNMSDPPLPTTSTTSSQQPTSIVPTTLATPTTSTLATPTTLTGAMPTTLTLATSIMLTLVVPITLTLAAPITLTGAVPTALTLATSTVNFSHIHNVNLGHIHNVDFSAWSSSANNYEGP
ncbi:hypothetical protein E4T56_gene5722 [Termitomyces sp. T112]|nr:hypothetical protein E4T56_gene5722 [Termitomyces sp. T112]